jgi:DNA modification methylase
MPELKVEYVATADLLPYARNSRTHSAAQVLQIAASIREFGFTNPVLISPKNDIIAGHGRVMAARKLEIDKVPCIRLGHLTATQRRAYVIADNQLALNSGWDKETLALELIDLKTADFDLKILGFSLDDLNALNPKQGRTDPDSIPEKVAARCKTGDLWQLGEHRLLCGDSTKAEDVASLMDGDKADMVFTDPPYGIDEETNRVEHVKTFKKQGIAKKGNYNKIAGDTSIDTAVAVFGLIEALGIRCVVYWGGNYYAHDLPNSSCWVVWDKRIDDNQRDLNSDCELAWVKHPHKASVRIFRHLWKGMIKGSEHGQARVHPTQKPIALAEWCFGELDPKGTSVLDLFLGSGSTLIACEKNGRRCFGMEIDPHYCDVILKRWEDFTGESANLVEPSPHVFTDGSVQHG